MAVISVGTSTLEAKVPLFAPGYPVLILPTGAASDIKSIENFVLGQGFYQALVWKRPIVYKVDISFETIPQSVTNQGVSQSVMVESVPVSAIPVGATQVGSSVQAIEELVKAQEAYVAPEVYFEPEVAIQPTYAEVAQVIASVQQATEASQALEYIQEQMQSLNQVNQGNQIMCTMEAKVCPDGSYVGRVAPNCDFAPCPTQVSQVSQVSQSQNGGSNLMDETEQTIQGTEQEGFDISEYIGGLGLPEWVTGSTWIEGVPNWALLAAGGLGLFLVMGSRR